jgi:hypothetical protein
MALSTGPGMGAPGMPPVPPPSGGRPKVARAGLTLSWKGGSGDVGLSLGQNAGGISISVTCVAPAASGSFTLPAEVTAELQPGDTSLVLTQQSSRNVRAGAFTVALSLAASPLGLPVSILLE